MERLLPLAEEVARLLKARKETVAVAESSTGGLILAALLALPGASAYCRGGVVIYTRNVLYAIRDVDKDSLRGLNPATEDYALFEARLARERFGADWGIGETGAAGPSGNSYGNPPGHTCVAVHGRAGRAATLNTGEADRVENMYAFSEAALELLAAALRAAP
jgi:PncC family amidohydrolase